MVMVTLYPLLGVIVRHHLRQGDVHQGSASLRKPFQGMTSDDPPPILYVWAQRNQKGLSLPIKLIRTTGREQGGSARRQEMMSVTILICVFSPSDGRARNVNNTSTQTVLHSPVLDTPKHLHKKISEQTADGNEDILSIVLSCTEYSKCYSYF